MRVDNAGIDIDKIRMAIGGFSKLNEVAKARVIAKEYAMATKTMISFLVRVSKALLNVVVS